MNFNIINFTEIKILNMYFKSLKLFSAILSKVGGNGQELYY
jgi:hypothetical protein